MPMQDYVGVKLRPNGNPLGVGFTGGGGVVDYFVPSFAGSGTLEVRFIRGNGSREATHTYNLTAGGQGVLALSRTVNGLPVTFFQDVSLCGTRVVGYIAYARGAACTIGRDGLDVEASGNFANAGSIADGGDFPETLDVGEAFAWCCVADSHGWSVGFVESPASGGGGLPTAIFSGQQAVTAAAVALPNNPSTQGVVLQALSSNGANIYFGPAGVTTATGKSLAPGQQATIEVANANQIFVIAAAGGSSVDFFGS